MSPERPRSPEETEHTESAEHIRTDEFIKDSIGAELQAMAQNEVPSERNDRVRELCSEFQNELLQLMNDDALRVLLKPTQVEYLKEAILAAVEFRYSARTELRMKIDKNQILAAATYINTLHSSN